VQVSANPSGIVKLPVYALYFVCEVENGTRLYLRQDVSVETKVLTNRHIKQISRVIKSGRMQWAGQAMRTLPAAH
jgi:hypothetical protein